MCIQKFRTVPLPATACGARRSRVSMVTRPGGARMALASMTTLRVTTPATRSAWDKLVSANASTVPSQTPMWLDAVCAHGPWEDASRLYETDDGRALVLPMARFTRLPRNLTSEDSMPSTWGTGGLLCADRVRAQDVAAVVADLCTGRALRTTVRPDFEQTPLWTAAARAAGAQELPITHHVLDLDRNFDQLWAGFSSA